MDLFLRKLPPLLSRAYVGFHSVRHIQPKPLLAVALDSYPGFFATVSDVIRSGFSVAVTGHDLRRKTHIFLSE